MSTNICNGCGGVLGRDCYNPRECEQISQQQYQNDNCQIEKLQAFKDYVHKRLDDAGIEKEPNGEHSEHGCRIGDRLDIVLKQNAELKSMIQYLIDTLGSLEAYELSIYNEATELLTKYK